jgi:protein gp37
VAETTIEWTRGPNGEPGFTFNPWIGCTKVSEGCTNCYAARQDTFRSWTPEGWGGPRRRTSVANWKGPLQWNAQAEREGRRYRVFCASLADVFDNQVPDEWREDLFGLIAATPNLDWLVLTKRVGNALTYFTDPATPRRIDTMKHVVLAGRLEERHAPERTAEVPEWPGYFITSKGRVLSDRTNAGTRGASVHEVKAQPGDAGHARVMLQVEGRWTRELVHRLVLTAFDRAPADGEQGCHIDGDPSNNALWNLRWGDQGSNWFDSKRHGTRRRYAKVSPEDVASIRRRADAGESAAAIARDFPISDTQVRNILRGAQWKPEEALQWPIPWLWLGATVVNQEEADRDIPKLLAVPARVRFLSIEPMLGPIYLRALRVGRDHGIPGVRPEHDHVDPLKIRRGIDWVIAGGESGPHARPAHPDWFRSLRDQCAAAGVPFLFKQWGEWAPLRPSMAGRVNYDGPTLVQEHCAKRRPKLVPGYAIPNAGEFPGWMFGMRVGKAAAGRLLDGIEHNGFPS